MAVETPRIDAPLRGIKTTDIIKTPKGPQTVGSLRATLITTGLSLAFFQACGGLPPATGSPDHQPTGSPAATMTSTPEATSTPEITPEPDYTFPGDLQSFVDKQIYAKNLFFRNASSDRLALNMIDDSIQLVNIPEVGAKFKAAQFQGYELGTEVIDGYLINYFGFKDAFGNQFFFPVNYGRIDSNEQNLLYHPSTALNDGSTGGANKISIRETQKALEANINNEIIFSLVSFIKTPSTNPANKSRDVIIAQSPIALRLMEWCLEAKKNSYKDIPMDPDIAQLINQRITHFDPKMIPMTGEVQPFKQP